jgi:hypothetical protein
MTIKLELRKIEYSKRLSEETPAYAAVLFVDGKEACHVGNNGHGGCDRQYWIGGNNSNPVRERVEAYFASLPERDTGLELGGKPFMLQPSLEGWCHEELDVQENVKRLKRTLAKKVAIITVDGLMYTYPTVSPKDLNDTARASIARKYPGCTFMTGMSDEKLREFVRGELSRQGA